MLYLKLSLYVNHIFLNLNAKKTIKIYWKQNILISIRMDNLICLVKNELLIFDYLCTINGLDIIKIWFS